MVVAVPDIETIYALGCAGVGRICFFNSLGGYVVAGAAQTRKLVIAERFQFMRHSIAVSQTHPVVCTAYDSVVRSGDIWVLQLEKNHEGAGVMRYYLYAILMLMCSGISSLRAQSLDLQLYESWHGDRNTSLDGIMEGFTASAYPVALATPALQLVFGLIRKDGRNVENGLQTATGLIIAGAVSYGLKYSVRRERPYVAHPQYQPLEYDASPSFPSGHTSFAFAAATSLSLQYKSWLVAAPAYLWAVGVGYSRIHTGAHYPGDVLGGAIVGAGAAYLSFRANQWLRHIWQRKTVKTIDIEP